MKLLSFNMHPQIVYYNSDIHFQSSGHLVSIILGINVCLSKNKSQETVKNSFFIQVCDSSFTFSPFPNYVKSKAQGEGVETQTKPTKKTNIKLNL